MTLVAVWPTSNDRLMAIADTRIVRSTGNVLTEHGPKLLPITITCRQPGPDGSLDRIAYRADIGFAYSGATLSALAAQALANTLCSNLVGASGAPPPSLAEIAYFIAGISADYMRDVAALSGMNGLFTAILFGYCPREGRLRTFKLTPNFANGGFQVEIVEQALESISLNGPADDSVVVIGSSPALLLQAIDDDLSSARARGEVHPIVALDAPKRALQSIISGGADEMVGGTIQQAWATQFGFKVVSNMVPITPRPPSTRNAGLFVLGFDTFDLQTVGHYQVAIEGR
jgi:hypothetical protein